MRLALGVAYRGQSYLGWQSQRGGGTVQDVVEKALGDFAAQPVRTVCAGRTDTGVHALNQVVHIDTDLEREPMSWVRGCNRYLPPDVALQWCQPVAADFHARNGARGRRYRYVLLESPVRPALENGLVGWVFRPLDGDAMRAAAAQLLGEHDFSSFRSSQCQSPTPVKTLRQLQITRRGSADTAYWHFDFEASAYLHHMVRNIMGCLLAVGTGRQQPQWMTEVLAARNRAVAAPTFSAAGSVLRGPVLRCPPWHSRAGGGTRLADGMKRTRIKICGLTREADVDDAIDAGADALGFVLYERSPRHITLARAATLAARLPPFVTPVLLFVNASPHELRQATEALPQALLQFHGDESPEQCQAWSRPWLRAVRMTSELDLLDFAARFNGAQALLLDAHVEGYGGGGKVFDWSLLPASVPLPVVLSGGLSPANVTAGVLSVRPWAVDVSSGVEASKGIKNAALMRRFCKAVREADQQLAAL